MTPQINDFKKLIPQREYNIYCDESCHLENDAFNFMIIGGIWCAKEYAKTANRIIKRIKLKHGFNPKFEIKWVKVSEQKIEFYHELLDYFFYDNELKFRGVIAQKKGLDHEQYEQDHDDWYYKMFFYLFRYLINKQTPYLNAYLDYKDSLGGYKIEELKNVLRNNYHGQDLLKKIELVDSSHVNVIQLTDLFLGIMGYEERMKGKEKSPGKMNLVNYLKGELNINHFNQTMNDSKFNYLFWEPRKA